jgi:hypothetical protein
MIVHGVAGQLFGHEPSSKRRFIIETSFATSPGDRYFEDYVPGAVHELGSFAVSEEEYLRRFDRQRLGYRGSHDANLL